MYENNLFPMFDTANETMQTLIEQGPLYMETILSLSDDIGSMADKIIETRSFRARISLQLKRIH